ncbi:MAG: transglycosylase SLT domain-containing protein [bacterium]
MAKLKLPNPNLVVFTVLAGISLAIVKQFTGKKFLGNIAKLPERIKRYFATPVVHRKSLLEESTNDLKGLVGLFGIKLERNEKTARIMQRKLAPFNRFIRLNEQSTGIPAKYIGAIIWIESSGNPNITGAAGDTGLMQITQDALTDVNQRFGFDFRLNDLLFPGANIAVGSRFLQMKIEEFPGDLKTAVRAYNCGATGARLNPLCGQVYAERFAQAVQNLESLS